MLVLLVIVPAAIAIPTPDAAEQWSLLWAQTGPDGAHVEGVADEVRVVAPQPMPLSREASDKSLSLPLAAA